MMKLTAPRSKRGIALRRAVGALVFALSFLASSAGEPRQASIRAITSIIEGHQVGGVAIDLVGNLYVADFGDLVWKISPDEKREVFTSGLYGSSGNAIDGQGNLLQSSYYGNSITRVDRSGHATAWATMGLSGPVGIAVDRKSGAVYVANCNGNTVSRIGSDGVPSTFAQSELLKCPNGIAFDRDGNLYVVNYRNNQMLKIDSMGHVAPFASVSKKGLGHLCFKKDRFFVTAFESHEVYEVKVDGAVSRILGTGERGLIDGTAAQARLSFPNGIACDPWAPRLYINEYDNDSPDARPRRAVVREILLPE
jgi:DNA-binding beta-propeller fold protein YncE